jgi:hypothetical protein
VQAQLVIAHPGLHQKTGDPVPHLHRLSLPCIRPLYAASAHITRSQSYMGASMKLWIMTKSWVCASSLAQAPDFETGIPPELHVKDFKLPANPSPEGHDSKVTELGQGSIDYRPPLRRQ